ncbi:MAG: hypothetical protein DHS20C15_27390 [Planctomycetota bacterium]|nr:MAG: hypothetical protein DHS20C15_27390 [Planctomycetota bacterium]
MGKVVAWFKEELVKIIPITIFFFVAFQLLALTQALMLREYGIEFGAFMNATIGALIVAKVVLLVDMLPLLNRFPERPLIYNVVWKTLIYFIAAFAVRYLEKLIEFWNELGDLGAANTQLLEKVVWPHFWVVQIWLFVLFFLFCTLRELVRVLGKQRVRAMFLGPLDDARE